MCRCHGADGSKSMMGSKPLNGPDVQKMSAADIAGAITNGKGKMPAYKGKLTDAQITRTGRLRQDPEVNQRQLFNTFATDSAQSVAILRFSVPCFAIRLSAFPPKKLRSGFRGATLIASKFRTLILSFSGSACDPRQSAVSSVVLQLKDPPPLPCRHCPSAACGVILAGTNRRASCQTIDPRKPETESGVTRRDFMKISAVGVAVPVVLGSVMDAAARKFPSRVRARCRSPCR